MAKAVIIYLVWIAILFAIVGGGVSFFEYKPTFPYSIELVAEYKNRLITTWAQFDGVHYLTIIKNGYEGTGLIQAFFPLYPLLVKLLSFGVFNPIIVGGVISGLSLFGGLYFLYHLIRLDESKATANKTLLLLLLFPTAFFLIALYTESLFFFLTVASFYAVQKKKWWLAGLFGLLAGMTRLVGVFLFPALVYEYWMQYGKKISINSLFCLGPVLGLLIYVAYLWITFGDPLLFYHVQSEFGANRTNTTLVLLPQVIYRYIKMLATTPLDNPIYPILIQEFVAGCAGIIGLIGAWLRLRKSYVVFGVGALLLPTLTGTFSSMPRYLLPIFPIFVVAAKYLPKRYFWLIAALSGLVLAYNLLRFTQGLWVS